MHLSVEREALLDSVSLALKGISSRNTIEILKGLFLKAQTDKLTLCTNNLEIAVKTSCACKVFQEGEIVADARILYEIIRKCAPGEIVLTVKDRFLHIQSHLAQFDVLTFEASDFPLPVFEQASDQITLPGSLFSEMIRKTAFAVAQNDSKPILSGVLFDQRPGELSLVALDGYRMAIRKAPFAQSVGRQAVIPGKTVSEIGRLCAVLGDEVLIGLSGKQAVFHLGNTAISTRLIEGDYINYEQILPTEFSTLFEISRADFTNALERVSLLSRNHLVRLLIENDHIQIESSHDEIGASSEKVPIALEGEPLRIGFNAKYFLDCLKNIEEEHITLYFNTSVTPCVLRPKEDALYTYLLLPVRL